ncbi:CusA/CzcA family heavy metal efflux RND transporter [Sphingobacteriaceae bacterium]|nr:CusA/CzcA family heavy metal efflux RND transporter [Sphingobacteriaceae bacterium]
MLDKIIHFSIKNKLIIGFFTLALILWGSYSLKQLPIDAVPDITNNQVQVITVSPSLAAQEIERLVTFPVEQTMATIPGIEEVRSFSRFGLSVVTIVFKEHVDVYWARQQVNERLTQAKTIIPQGVGTPELAPLTTGLGEIYQYVIHTKKGFEKKYTPMELRTIQDWIVRRQLLGTEGVADISSFGGYVKQYEIALNPDKLRSMNISISEVFTALQKNNQNTGGAYIDKKPNAYFIRSEGLIGSLEDIERIVVKTYPNGIPVLMRNVATIGFGHATRYGAMTRNSEGEVVGAIVMMLKGANSSKVIASVKERITQIEKTLPEGVVIEPFLDRTKLVNNAIGTVTKNLAEGALIVIFVLVLLLGNLRAGLIVASVIPLAMLFAISLMNLFGVSGNLMSLGAIDFGLIVDGAVIIVEASLHHLVSRKLNKKLTQTEMDEEVYQSASKIRSSAAFGEIIILIVYLPILALVGVEGKMFRPMAQTVSFAILGAFILSLTYVPMISALFLNKNTVHKKTVSDRIMDFFQRSYRPLLIGALRNKVSIVISAAVLFIFSLIVFLNMGGEFIPTLDEGDFAVETRVLTGSSISQTIEAALRSAKILKEKFPEVIEVIGKIGSSEIPTDPMPVEACDLMVILKDKSEWTSASSRDELAEKMSQALEDIPGVTFGFQQPIQMRFNELMSGAKQDVVIKIYGEDLDMLTEYAVKVGKLTQGIKGAQDLYVEQATGQQQIVIKFDRDKIAQFGLTIEDVNQIIKTGFAGESAGLIYEGEKRFDLVVRLEKENRQSIEDINNLFVIAPNGNQVPVSQLAEVEFKISPNQIQRDDAKRRITLGFNVRGRDVESVVKEMQAKVDKEINFNPGYYPTYGGTFKNLVEARQRLSIAVPVALFLIFILLYFTFNSIKQSLLILTAIPLSAIGGVFALWLRGMPFSISAGVGFIALFGVAVLNGIVLISEFNSLKKEGMNDLKEIILKGTSTRLRPVIMTALVASLGFLPMALSHGSGAEVQKPLATVVIGGLLSATLLTLLVLPILYFFFEKMGKKKTSLPTVAILLLLLLPTFGTAQTVSSGLTEQQIVDEALKNNAGIKAATYEINYSKTLKRTSSDIGKTNISVMHGQYNSVNTDNNISINQSIPFPTVFLSQTKLNNALVKGSELKLLMTQNELISQVKSAYYNLQFLKAQKKLLITQDSIYTSFSKAAELRLKTGESNLLERTTAETQLMEVRNLLAQNSSNILIYQAHLQVLVNAKSEIAFSEMPFKKLDLTLPADSSTLSQNPAISYVKQQIEISNRQKKVEAAKSLPDFNVGYFNQSLIGYQNVNGTDQYFDGSKRFTGIQVGISIPLWFFPQAARVKAADINQQVVQSNFEQYRLNLQGQYSQALQEFLKNKNTLVYYETNAIPNAELLIKQADKGFKSGEIGYVEYLQGLKNALSIRENYLQAIQQYNQSVIALEFLIGKK